jgi:hypothetical protein
LPKERSSNIKKKDFVNPFDKFQSEF